MPQGVQRCENEGSYFASEQFREVKGVLMHAPGGWDKDGPKNDGDIHPAIKGSPSIEVPGTVIGPEGKIGALDAEFVE